MRALPHVLLFAIALGVAALLPSEVLAQASDTSRLDSAPGVIGNAVAAVENAFASRGTAVAGALTSFALKLLALSYVFLLSWSVLRWFMEGKPLPALVGAFLNTTLSYAMVLALLVPVAGTSGYATAVGMVQDFTNSIASAAGATSASDLITSGLKQIFRAAINAIGELWETSKRLSPPTGIWDAITGSVISSLVSLLVVPVVIVCLILCLIYCAVNLAKAMLYGIIAWHLGVAVGPVFIALMLVPMLSEIGRKWFAFMITAGLIKFVAAFIITAVTAGMSTLAFDAVKGTATDTAVGILTSYVALAILLLVIGWILGSVVTLANALMPGTIGSPGSASIVGAAVGAVAAAATAGAAMVAAKGAAVAAGTSGAATGAGSAGAGAATAGSAGTGSTAAGLPVQGAQIAGNAPKAMQPVSSMAGSNAPTAGATPLPSQSRLLSVASGAASAPAKVATAAWKIGAAAAQGASSGAKDGGMSGFTVGMRAVKPSKTPPAGSSASAQSSSVGTDARKSMRDAYTKDRVVAASNAYKRANGGRQMSAGMASAVANGAQQKFDAARTEVMQRYERALASAAQRRPASSGTSNSAGPSAASLSSMREAYVGDKVANAARSFKSSSDGQSPSKARMNAVATDAQQKFDSRRPEVLARYERALKASAKARPNKATATAPTSPTATPTQTKS